MNLPAGARKAMARAACAAVAMAAGASTAAFAEETVASWMPQPSPSTGASTAFADGAPEGLASRLLSRTGLNWTAQLNGPALGGPEDSNYNTYQNSHGPRYLYHTVDLLHFVGRSSQLGMELSAKQDFGHAITYRKRGQFGEYDHEVQPERSIYDPQFWFRQNGIHDGDWVAFDAALNVWPGLTSYSREQERLAFAAALDGYLRFKFPSYRWRAALASRLKPSFYAGGGPTGSWAHEQVFLSTSPSLSYQLSSSFELVGTAQFDFKYYKDDVGGFRRGDAYDDKAQLQLNYYHPSGLARVGAYAQGLIVNPALATATVGLDLTIHFLRAR